MTIMQYHRYPASRRPFSGGPFWIVVFILTLIAFACVLTSCRTTQSSSERVHQSTDTTSVLRTYTDSLSHALTRLDSVRRATYIQDSILRVTREQSDHYKATFRDHFTMVRDSVDVRIDSTGRISYYFFKTKESETYTHDTIYINRSSYTYTKEITSVRDSLYTLRAQYDSLRYATSRNDSIYAAHTDSVLRNDTSIISTHSSWWDRLQLRMLVMCITFALLAVVSYLIKRKYDD